jgi:hypothetical protein
MDATDMFVVLGGAALIVFVLWYFFDRGDRGARRGR